MVQESQQGRSKLFEGISSLFRAAPSASAAEQTGKQGFDASANALDSAISTLKSGLQKRKNEIEAQARAAKAAASGSAVSSTASGPSAKELRQRELEAATQRMKEDIIKLHSELNTGLSEKELAGIQSFLLELQEQLENTDLDARIRLAIAEHVYSNLGNPAWKILVHFMEKAGVSWPQQEGFSSPSQEDKSGAIAERIDEAEELFVEQKFIRGVESMLGKVDAWKRYPDPGSWLWQDGVLRAVASGIRCKLMQDAVERLRTESDELRSRAKELINESMSKIQQVLEGGVRSLEEAEKVVQGTEVIIQQVIPDLAWQTVKEDIDKKADDFVNRR